MFLVAVYIRVQKPKNYIYDVTITEYAPMAVDIRSVASS